LGYAVAEAPTVGMLTQSLLLAGRSTGKSAATDMGLRSLRWLVKTRTNKDGTLLPLGKLERYDSESAAAPVDQQPVEAHALLEACIEAYNATEDEKWLVDVRRSFDWFLGKNALNKCLYDYETGGCRDGLHQGGLNENEGAEATLAWLLSLMAIRSLEPAVVQSQTWEEVEEAEPVSADILQGG
jgi:hypothetical protein